MDNKRKIAIAWKIPPMIWSVDKGDVMSKKSIPERPDVSSLLRQAITASGLSLNALSRTCGVDPGRLSRFMRSERDLNLDAVAKICKALGFTLTAVEK